MMLGTPQLALPKLVKNLRPGVTVGTREIKQFPARILMVDLKSIFCAANDALAAKVGNHFPHAPSIPVALIAAPSQTLFFSDH